MTHRRDGARRAALLEILKIGKSLSHRALAQELKQKGFSAHQTTVTRDLKALGYRKIMTPAGHEYLEEKELPNPPRLNKPFWKLWVEEGAACVQRHTWVALSTRPGMGRLLEEAANDLSWKGLAAVLGGSKAVLLVFDDRREARGFAELAGKMSALQRDRTL